MTAIFLLNFDCPNKGSALWKTSFPFILSIFMKMKIEEQIVFVVIPRQPLNKLSSIEADSLCTLFTGHNTVHK